MRGFWKIALGFVPWILYDLLLSSGTISPYSAILITLASTLLLDFKELKKGFVIAWCTLIFFSALLVLVFLFPSHPLFTHTGLLTNGGLALMSWISLLINKPFTLQYAREQVQKEMWQLPGFIRANRIITAVWGFCFTVSATNNFFHNYGNINQTIYQILSYAPSIFAIWFTIKFPKWYKQHRFNQAIQKSERQQKSNPFLKGNYAPVHKELDLTDLKIEGELPKDLLGIYMRNGPNPAFAPFSYTYPFDGDGMLHAIYIRDGKASYRNRFIETDQLRVERRLGQAVYGGVDCPFIKNPSLLLPEDPTFPIKLGRFIHIIKHANSYVALHEANSAYEVDAELRTLGEWTPIGAQKPIAVNPHPRLDPETGELYLVSYHVDRPVITYHVLDKRGKITHEGTIEIPQATMMHDFVLTKKYFILFMCPVSIDMYGKAKGKHLFNWQPELNTKIALVSRANPSNILWIESEPFFTYHFANAFEAGSEIHVDYVRYPQFTMETNKLDRGHLYRTTINPAKKQCSHKQLDDRTIEFPRINDQKNASSYQYAYILADLNAQREFNAITKYDVKTSTALVHDFGPDYEIGEAVFVPKAGSTEEDDGYLMLFASRRSTQKTEFLLLDAKHIANKPIARIPLPQRVPHGLHGSWMPGPW